MTALNIKVSKAKAREYKRIIFSGEQSMGKTKAAFNWSDNPLWIDLDKRIPEEIIDQCNRIEGVDDYDSLKSTLVSIKNADEFEYDSLIIDTFTIAESFARDTCIVQDFNGDRNAYSNFSRGDKQHLILYVNPILALLDRIAEKHGCDVILICHSEVKPIKNPNGESYDKVVLCLVEKIRNRVLQWADYVGFAWEDVTLKVDGIKKKVSDSVRKITFSSSPKWDAKGPSHLPVDIIFDTYGEWIKSVKKPVDKVEKAVESKPVQSKPVPESKPERPMRPLRGAK